MAKLVIEKNEAYHANKEWVSKSRLVRMASCPKTYLYYEEHDQDETQALVFGNAFHKYVLEPETFEDEVAVTPTIDRRTNAGKEAYREFCEKSDGKYIINEVEFGTIKDMTASLMECDYARKLLRSKKNNVETSIYYVDEFTGEKCKSRPDVWRRLDVGDKVRYLIVDLKSCRSASNEQFSRDAIKHGYDVQAFMARTAVAELNNVPIDCVDFVFVAVEKDPPYLVNIFEVLGSKDNRDDFDLLGESNFRKYIGMLHDCKQTNNWYSYMGASGIANRFSVPSWLTNTADEEE